MCWGGFWRQAADLAALAAVAGLALVLAGVVPVVNGELVAHGRFLPSWRGQSQILYVGEGMSASVAVTEAAGVRSFHVSGKVEASSQPDDMRLQRMLGQLPALLHPGPKSVLIVGCGAGVTAGCFVLHPGIERIVICDIEPLIPRLASNYFSRENYNVVEDPRVTILHDDARHYILTTKDTFDIITSDPIHPWVKDSATLYSQEYFELCRRHLKPGGFVTQWVPLYESDVATVKSEIATFFRVFPEGTVWDNDVAGKGYDVVLLGQAEPLRIDVDRYQERLNSHDGERASVSLFQVGFASAAELLSNFGGRAAALAPWLADAQINRDRSLRLQYLAGMGLNADQGQLIHDEMRPYRSLPEDLFVGSEKRIEELRKAFVQHR